MKASVLAVGSELTSGQIINGNAAWISRRLADMGLQTEIHLTVPDERALILEALSMVEKKSDFIFVCGGLGPTSDDFTRELITDWAQQPLVFHQPSWEKIQQRLTARGLPIGEFQKQQCYFPQSSQVLENSAGTANAFYLKKHSKHLWALPGPPNEIAAIWTDHIHSQMQNLTKDLNRFVTVSWDALDLGEAIAPSLVEPAALGSGAEIGYRVHLPYLEIKFSYYQSDQAKMQPYIEKIETALKPFTVSRNGEDIIDRLKALLSTDRHLFIRDQVTEGLLLNRIQSIRYSNSTFTTDQNLNAPPSSWQILCRSLGEFEMEIELLAAEKNPFKKVIRSPFNQNQSSQMSGRRRKYFAEMILITAVQHWE